MDATLRYCVCIGEQLARQCHRHYAACAFPVMHRAWIHPQQCCSACDAQSSRHIWRIERVTAACPLLFSASNLKASCQATGCDLLTCHMPATEASKRTHAEAVPAKGLSETKPTKAQNALTHPAWFQHHGCMHLQSAPYLPSWVADRCSNLSAAKSWTAHPKVLALSQPLELLNHLARWQPCCHRQPSASST